MASVSVIIPCYNEEKRIESLLNAIDAQTFPIADMEIIIADGMSTDGTRASVAKFQQEHPSHLIKLVDNPKRIIPAGLNRALENAQGVYIIRLDGHSKPYPDYIERCVDLLNQGKGVNVGGVWEIQPGAEGWIARSISAAAAHPFGVGDALYRYTNQACEVDTVPFGAFKREILTQFGGYDESLLTNEDYELNARIRKAGGKIWLDPGIRSIYYARSSLADLSRQYWRYGFWKFRMLHRYPETIRLRQALPPLFVLCLVMLLALLPFWELARGLFLFVISLYFLVIIAGAIPSATKHKDVRLIVGTPLAIFTMHFTWGSGFLWSIISRMTKPKA